MNYVITQQDLRSSMEFNANHYRALIKEYVFEKFFGDDYSWQDMFHNIKGKYYAFFGSIEELKSRARNSKAWQKITEYIRKRFSDRYLIHVKEYGHICRMTRLKDLPKDIREEVEKGMRAVLTIPHS